MQALIRRTTETTAVILLVLFAFGASFTQRVTGFGFGILMMTILPHIMPSYGEATALSGMLAFINVCATAVRNYRHIIWQRLLPILLTFLLVSFFSVKAVSIIDGHILKRVFGGILIAISIYLFLFSGRIHVKPSFAVQASLGTLSGLMGGFFAMQGPPAVVYFLSSTESKEQYIAQISAYFLISNLMMTGFRAADGLVTVIVFKAWLWALPAVAAGYLLGRTVYGRIPLGVLRKVVYAFMAISGMLALCLA